MQRSGAISCIGWRKNVVVLVCAGLIVAACGGDDDDGAEGAQPTAAADVTAAAGGSETTGGTAGTTGGGEETSLEGIDRERTLRIGANIASSPWVDPKDDQGNQLPVGWWLSLIYGKMIGVGQDGEPKPGLLTEWSAPDDNTLELTLREGVTFSDGTPFNADAVKYSWERCKNDGGFVLDLFDAYESSEVVDDTHLTVHLNRPFAGVWINYLLTGAVYCIGVVSPTAAESAGDAFSENPVGAGPYLLESYEPDQKIVLVRNPDYHAPDEQNFAKIEFIQAVGGAPTVTALASGQVDIASVDIANAEAVEQAGLNVISGPGPNMSHLAICATEPPLDNVDARRAILHAIDPEELNLAVSAGLDTPFRLLTPPWYRYHSEVGVEDLTFDLDLAKELAESSGLAGQTIDLMYWTVVERLARSAEVLKAQIERIGVTVNLVPSQGLYADAAAQKPDLETFVHAPYGLNNSLQPGTISNYCNNDFPDVNAAVEDIWVADEQRAQEAFDSLQAAVNETVPILPYQLWTAATASSDDIVGNFWVPVEGNWGFPYDEFGLQQ